MGTFYNINVEGPSLQFQVELLVERIGKKNPVVILVDEYDHPIINNLENPDLAEENRKSLKKFFETFKSLDKYIKFTFITGVSKFLQASIFSGLNNLKDITMDPNYAAITGYTEEELKENFKEHIEAIVHTRKQKKSTVSRDEIIDEIRLWYNGYRFSEKKLSVYNPFSTLNYMNQKKAESYWYSSGTPSFLIAEIKKHPKSMVSLDGTQATKEELIDSSRLDEIDIIALMYQTGYFTIKNYNDISKRYQLAFPNEEVRSAFIKSLIKSFTPISKLKESEEFVQALENHKPDLLFGQVELGFASFPYQVFVDAKECTYQGMLLSMLYGMGFDPLSERITNTGRVDVVLELPKTFCVIELKLNASADVALKQIHEKEYFKPYTQKGKNILIVGANFSSTLKNISDWKGEVLSESGEVIKAIHQVKKKASRKKAVNP